MRIRKMPLAGAAAALAVGFPLSGCASDEGTGALIGAGIGAVVGLAIADAVSDDDHKHRGHRDHGHYGRHHDDRRHGGYPGPRPGPPRGGHVHGPACPPYGH